ncbi:MAG: hypothetical protein GXY48_07970 [Methanomicrobiales archaeon]|nr:hypothetical protein [Methanomicrobiales archaeon]
MFGSELPMQTWLSNLSNIIPGLKHSDFCIPEKINPGTDTYLVPSPDKQDLQFHFPVIIKSGIMDTFPLPVSASAGAVHAIIEHCKKTSMKDRKIGLLHGITTSNQSRYAVNTEPCTITSSRSNIASNLWRADDLNTVVPGGIKLGIRGAIPNLPVNPGNISRVVTILYEYIESMVNCVNHVPEGLIKKEWEATHDQQVLRKQLAKIGLVCFIGDGTRPARRYTRHRSWYRIAGPKDGVHVPFYCPTELSPVEIYLKGSNRTITGLGIRKGEIFAITGSNAEGKSTLLQAVLAGEDDHAIGDGRELVVTVQGGLMPDATSIELKGDNLAPFFDSLPPGMSGSPSSAYGQGSGSASMASRISGALRKKSPYIIIDEDRSAQNLMVPCYMSSSEIHALATLVRNSRELLSDTSLILAGSGMELLIAQADRIIRFSNHEAQALSVTMYREGLSRHYDLLRKMIPEKDPGEERSHLPVGIMIKKQSVSNISTDGHHA